LTRRRRSSRRDVSQRFTQNLVDRIDQHELHLAPEVSGDVVEVRLIAGGQKHAPDPGPVRTEHLLLDAADRQHASAQRDLAGHRNVIARRASGEDRSHRRQYRHAGRRPFLRLRSCRDMDMDVVLVEE
jgi:hypothetical protein